MNEGSFRNCVIVISTLTGQLILVSTPRRAIQTCITKAETPHFALHYQLSTTAHVISQKPVQEVP